MYIPEKLKLNKFRFVDIPKPITYFKRFGYQSTNPVQFTGDQVAPASMSKIDEINLGAKINENYLELETKQANDSLNVDTE